MSWFPVPMSPHPQQQMFLDEEELSYYLLMQKQSLRLAQFWSAKMQEIPSISEFKGQHDFPLARIKRIMKANQEVKMISAESQIIFAKACELFILELTLRASFHSEANKRRTLQPCDIGRAIRSHPPLHFLRKIVPYVHEEVQGDENNPGGNDAVHFPAANHDLTMRINNEIPGYVHEQPHIPSETVNKNRPKRGKFD